MAWKSLFILTEKKLLMKNVELVCKCDFIAIDDRLDSKEQKCAMCAYTGGV